MKLRKFRVVVAGKVEPEMVEGHEISIEDGAIVITKTPDETGIPVAVLLLAAGRWDRVEEVE